MDDARSRAVDPYGDLDAIADASWTECWTGWAPEQRAEYMTDMAAAPALSMSQMQEIVQGLPPTPSSWLPSPTCLAEFAAVLDRLAQDVQRGVLSSASTPAELAAWCDKFGVDLPDAFVRGLAAARTRAQTRAAQSPIAITPPPWAPLPIQHQKAAPVAKARGRPATAAYKYDRMRATARSILMEAARNGRKMTGREVAEAVADTPDGLGMSIENIARRLKSNLPLDQARATADKHQRKVRRP